MILTRSDADAYYGLDDLREWGFRQGASIPVYLSQATYNTVAQSFPYLVDSSQASGGGDIPQLLWNIIDDTSSFTVHDIHIQALPLHHGVYFDAPPEKSLENRILSNGKTKRPLICLGFMFDRDIVYMSDVSFIPEETWEIIERQRREIISNGTVVADGQEDGGESGGIKGIVNGMKTLDSSPSPIPNGHNNVPSRPPQPQLPILIIDALWPFRTHTSHFSFSQALSAAIRLNPSITYLTGMTHPTTHFEWEELALSVSGKDGQQSESGFERADHPDAESAKRIVGKVWRDVLAGESGKEVKSWGGRVEPCWDGLGVEVGFERGSEGKDGEGKGWREVASVGGWDI